MTKLSTRRPYLSYVFLSALVSYVVSHILNQKPNEEARGLIVDNIRKTYWIYTDSSLYELVISNEDRDVWKVYLEKGQPDIALKYAKVR